MAVRPVGQRRQTMNDDLISRAEAIDEMRKMYHAAEKWLQEAEDDTMKARAESCMATLVEMKLRVEKLPSAERRGKWIDEGIAFVSSECSLGSDQWTNYCPNCGAKMESEE